MDNDVNKDVVMDQEHEQEQEQTKEEKLFTQAEVEEIIKNRLKRVKNKHSEEEAAALQAARSEIEEREKTLQAKETRLQCKEYLMSENLPTDLLDAIDTSDFEQFKIKAGIIDGHMRKNQDTAPPYNPEPVITGNGLKGGFDPDYKHKPKQLPGYYGD